MQPTPIPFKSLLIALSLSAGLSACSSGGGSDPDEQPPGVSSSSTSGGASSSGSSSSGSSSTSSSSTSSSSTSGSSTSSSSTSSGGQKPGVVSFSTAAVRVDETAGSVTLQVVRSGAGNTALDLPYSLTADTATAGADFTGAGGTLSWAAGENGTKTITVDILQDDTPEGDERFLVTLGPLTGGDTLGENATASVTITDTLPQACIDLRPLDITVDTRLSAPCYWVSGRVEVENNATLTIAPGVRLEFDTNAVLWVHPDGVLQAVGTEEAPIIMTGRIEAPGYWGGVTLRSLGESRLDYVTVQYGGQSGGSSAANLMVSHGGRASISNSTFAHSAAYGVHLWSDDTAITRFENNTLTGNQGTPLAIDWNLASRIGEGNRFEGNAALDGTVLDRILLTSDRVTRNTTLADHGVPYRAVATGFVRITAGLTIEPGVTLAMREDSRLWVESGGGLYARGTEDAPITFTATTKAPGSWLGIGIFGSAQENILEHTVVEYAGAEGNFVAAVGVGLSGSKLTVNDSIIRHSQNYGLQIQGSNQAVTLNRNTYTNNNRTALIEATYADELDPASSYTGNTLDLIALSGGSISGVGTLRNLEVPYRVLASRLTLEDRLTIEPGVELQFVANSQFSIERNGSLVAVGTPEAPIVFTGLEATKGFWQGIQFTFTQSEANRVQHAVVEYGGGLGGNTDGLIGLFGDAFAHISDTVLRASATNGLDISSDRPGIVGENLVFEDIDGDDIVQR